MFSFDHDLMEWVSIGPGVVSDDGSRITSREGFGVRHAGWGGAPPPPPPTCNIKCNDGNECTSDSKNDCFCTNKLIPDKVKSDQTEGDCKTATCGGSEDAPTDVPEDIKYDCKSPICDGGSPDTEPDDSDISEEDVKCSKCEGGEVVADEIKNEVACGDGSPKQECLVCKDGQCGPPDCDASKNTQSLSFETNEIAKNFFAKVNRIANVHPLINIQVTPYARGSYQTGEECCKDCTEQTRKGTFHKVSGALGADLSASLGPKREIDYDCFTCCFWL